MKYIKKQSAVEATQWFKNGDHPLDYARDIQGIESGVMRVFTGLDCQTRGWEGQVVRYYRHPEVSGQEICKHCGSTMHVHGWLDTLDENGLIVCPGDWILTNSEGDQYPKKPDIFAAAYEPVEGTDDAEAVNGGA